MRTTRPSPALLMFLLATTALLAACQSTPGVGSHIQAQVLDVVRDPAQLQEGHPELHAALRAGVLRRDLEEGRLVQGECGVPDASAPQGMRWHTVTTVLPEGQRAVPGSALRVDAPRGAWPAGTPSTAPRLHGRYAGVTAPAAPTPTLCHPAGQADAAWHIRVRSSPPAWSFDFAQAALQRLDAFSSADFAQGRVLRVACQLKAMDGGRWHTPVWIARAPAAGSVKPGDVVQLRAGAEANSKDAGPVAEVLQVRADVKPAPGNAVVPC